MKSVGVFLASSTPTFDVGDDLKIFANSISDLDLDVVIHLADQPSAPYSMKGRSEAIDTQTGTEFLLKNKKQIEGIIQNAYNRRGKQGIY